MTFPSWLMIILSILTILSFYPQIFRIWSRRESTGISIYYVLFNLIAATEQFTIMFFMLVNNNTEPGDIIVHRPHNTGDWLNLCQMSITWILFLVLFSMTLYFLPNDRLLHKCTALAIYSTFLLISVVPEIFDILSGIINDPKEDRRWLVAIFGGYHLYYINPDVTILMILSIFFQAYKILQGKSSALNLVGLMIQSIIFALLGVSFLLRLRHAPPDIPTPARSPFIKWYLCEGWAAVDHFIFAVGQVTLLCLSIWYNRRRPVEEVPSREEETEPLLGQN